MIENILAKDYIVIVMDTKKRKTNTEYAKLNREISDAINAKTRRKKIRVLVFGPDVTHNEPSAKLRKYIINKCKKHNYTVVLSEHEDIRQLYESIFGSANDLCNMEYHLAWEKIKHTKEDIIDGIVIIPDSAGSFIELGMLALEDSVHQKILVLFNKTFEPGMSGNFIGLGAKAAYDNGNARTIILDYTDKKTAWGEVAGFLDLRRSKKYWQRIKRQHESTIPK